MQSTSRKKKLYRFMKDTKRSFARVAKGAGVSKTSLRRYRDGVDQRDYTVFLIEDYLSSNTHSLQKRIVKHEQEVGELIG